MIWLDLSVDGSDWALVRLPKPNERGPNIVAFVAVRPARGDVDLTGSWTVEVDIAETLIYDVVQSGTSLTIGPFSGTNDPVTGAVS